MRKLSAKWVPKCLNADQKSHWCQSFEQILEFFWHDPNNFLSQLLTMDETQLYHYYPETKKQSMEWWYSSSHRPKTFLVQKSSGKVLASIFWNQDSIILIHYLPKGQTINGENYTTLLLQLKDIWKEKFCRKVNNGVLFLHDNASVHWALATEKQMANLVFQCLDHLPYSLDLALLDYHLFPGVKKQLKGHHFSSDAEDIAAAETCFDGKVS